jgi:hypothetical protein
LTDRQAGDGAARILCLYWNLAAMNLAEANLLRLSNSQLAIVRQAAVLLSPSARDRYLKTVVAELAEAERVDDATVKAVVETVLCTLIDDETGGRHGTQIRRRARLN